MINVVIALLLITEFLKYGIWYGIDNTINRKKLWIGIAISGVYLLLIFSGIFPVDLPILFTVFICAGSFIPTMQCEWSKKIFSVVKALFLVNCMNEIVGGMLQLFLTGRNFSLYKDRNFQLIINVIIIPLLLVGKLLKERIHVSKVLAENKYFRMITYAVIGVVGIFLYLTIGGVQYLSDMMVNKQQRTILFVVSIIAYMGVGCLEMGLIYIMDKIKEYQRHLKTSTMLVQAHKNMYETMLVKNEEIRKIKHDMNKQMICLRELACQGNVDNIKKYINDLEGQLKQIDQRYYQVGNDVIDAILNYYLAMLDEEVDITLKGRCECDIDVNQLELCTIIGNLVENAVEEVSKTKNMGRYISIKLETGKFYIIIEIENSMFEEKTKKNRLFVTEKKDKLNHGWGLINIREVAEKNHGRFEFEAENEKFTARVSLPLVNRMEIGRIGQTV